jgi:hypothetical protein
MGAEERRMRPFAETLAGLVASLDPPEGSGLTVTSATLDVPLEGSVVEMHGESVFVASLPHTRWRSGFLPPVHMAHVEVREAPVEDEG